MPSMLLKPLDWIELIEIVFFRVDKIVKERKSMHKMYNTSSNSIRLLKVNVKNNNNNNINNNNNNNNNSDK